VIETAAVQVSDLMPLLKDSFESLSLFHQSSQIGSQHPIVGATSVGGFIKIGGYLYYNFLEIFDKYRIIFLSGCVKNFTICILNILKLLTQNPEKIFAPIFPILELHPQISKWEHRLHTIFCDLITQKFFWKLHSYPFNLRSSP
jgi:hypothetical protein